MAKKAYDETYFETWYRDDNSAIAAPDIVGRKIAAAVAVTELVLDRPLESVLDIGCGEGRWQPGIYRLRPQAAYLGIDPSDYVVERFGGHRNIRQGRLGDLGLHDFDEPFDLIVCSDVLHYLERPEIERGLAAITDRLQGVAFLEVFTRSDEVEGDLVDFKRRPTSAYRRMFSTAGLVPIGLQFYVPKWLAPDLDALELPS